MDTIDNNGGLLAWYYDMKYNFKSDRVYFNPSVSQGPADGLGREPVSELLLSGHRRPSSASSRAPHGSSAVGGTMPTWAAQAAWNSARRASTSVLEPTAPTEAMTVPETPNSASSPELDVAPSRMETVWPRASSICDARVRFQISS